jgi:putative inorganic carbon (HCO3(-)) transporter
MGASFVIKKLLQKEKLFIHTPLNWAFIALLVVSVISLRNSVDLRASFFGLTKLFKYFLMFLIYAEEIKDIRQITRIIVSIALGACLVSIDAVWQCAFGRDFICGNPLQSRWDTPAYVMSIARANASFSHPNGLAGYLTSITPLITGLALFSYRGKAKILLMCASVLALLGIVLTFSRGAGLGVYLAVLYMGIVKKQKLLIMALLGVVLLSPFVMPRSIKSWAHAMHYNPIVLMCNYERLSLYRNTINIIKHHPFVGVGTNTFIKNYEKYKLPEPENAVTPKAIYAHNIYLHMAAEIGLLGLGAFLWFLFLLFRQGIMVYHALHDEYLKIIAFSLLACCIAFLVNGLTETNLYYPRVVIMFWYLIGFSLALKKFSIGQ